MAGVIAHGGCSCSGEGGSRLAEVFESGEGVRSQASAVLFRLVLENAPAGTAWRRLDLPVKPVPEETYGPLGPIFATDQPSFSTYTREALDRQPRHPSLLEDLENLRP